MWFLLLISFFAGGFLGMILASLFFVSKEADRAQDLQEACLTRKDLAAAG